MENKRRIYYLSTCSTNADMFRDAGPIPKHIEMVDIKADGVNAEDLDYAAKKVGSYDALFSRRALKYKSMGLAQKQLTEADIRGLILEEYTFLKRPLILLDDQVFYGNTKQTTEQLKNYLAILK